MNVHDCNVIKDIKEEDELPYDDVEGIHMKSKPVNIIKPLSSQVFKNEEQEPLITQTHDVGKPKDKQKLQ